MKKYIYIILLGFAGMNAFSQALISGKVTGIDGSLPGASVYLEGTYDGTSTNDTGEFSFTTSKKGKAIIMVSYIGYEPASTEIELKGTPTRSGLILNLKKRSINWMLLRLQPALLKPATRNVLTSLPHSI